MAVSLGSRQKCSGILFIYLSAHCVGGRHTLGRDQSTKASGIISLGPSTGALLSPSQPPLLCSHHSKRQNRFDVLMKANGSATEIKARHFKSIAGEVNGNGAAYPLQDAD